jgi:hypothetical protein
MKVKEEILEKQLETVEQLSIFYKNVVWEPQEGQQDHFDNLNKAEQVALIEICSDIERLKCSLANYKHWFK